MVRRLRQPVRDLRPSLGCLLLLTLLGASPARSQDLVGCQLVGASLQCVPGVTESPQQQIRQLKQEMAADLQLEGAVQQQIDGLQQLVLRGEATVGAVLTASLLASAQASLPAASYHWYRLSPDDASWVWIADAWGTDYVPVSADVGQTLMVVAVVNQSGVIKRVASRPVGPVQP
jgi:hypothetical protein